MLVKFTQPAVFTMKIDVQKGIFKKKVVTHTEYVKLCVANGVCDESEIDAKIQKGIAEVIAENEKYGYYDIKVCTDVDALMKKYPFDTEEYLIKIAQLKPNLIYLSDLKVADIIKLVNGKQFIQFCNETKQSMEEAIQNG